MYSSITQQLASGAGTNETSGEGPTGGGGAGGAGAQQRRRRGGKLQFPHDTDGTDSGSLAGLNSISILEKYPMMSW